MQDNKQNINELDTFSESVKSKLENHQLPLDADLWNSIQQAVEAKKRRRMPLWLWIPMSSVAVIALILMLRPVAQSPELLSKSVNSQNTKQIQFEESTTRKTTTYTATTKSKKKNFISSRHIKPVQVATVNPVTTSLINKSINQNIDTTAVVNSVLAFTEPNDSIIRKNQPIKPDSVNRSLNIATLTEKSTFKTESKVISKSKYKNQWLLAASFGSGSSASSGLDNVPMATVSNDIVKAGTTFTSIMAPQSFSNINYNLPVSFGLRVRNKFSETLSIETGLIYTYLQTDFSNSGFTTTDARLSLHYLGIPVCLNVKIWSNPKWEIYVSGGGTVEKGLRSIYVQTQNYSYQSFITTTRTNIDGLQYSVNSAIGIGYRIFPKTALFFEPQFSYYFDNNQPISIRSKQPAVFNMQIGLRYNLNSVKK